MIDNLQMFWDFFIYPLTVIDSAGLISDVLLMCIVVFSIFDLTLGVVEWSQSAWK